MPAYNYIYCTPLGICGWARVPEANKLVPCKPEGCKDFEEKSKRKE